MLLGMASKISTYTSVLITQATTKTERNYIKEAKAICAYESNQIVYICIFEVLTKQKVMLPLKVV